MLNQSLPLHPTKLHPLTGKPLQAIWVRPDGRVMWPIIGGAPADGEGGAGGEGAGGEGAGAGAGGTGTGSGSGAGGGKTNATDAQGNDLGFPKDTPTAEMTDKEQAAYWKNNSRKHEGLWKGIAGDRKPEEVRADLDAYAEAKKAEQTPAEQALTERYDQGKAEGLKAARSETASAIFRGALEAAEIGEDDIEELVTNFNVANFVTDEGVDTKKITNFAKRFSTPGTGQQRQRDFGAGQRREGQPSRGAGGKAEAAKRFKKTTTGS